MSTSDLPPHLTLLGSIPRTGRFNLLWSLSIALFLWAIEWAGREPQDRYGLVVNLCYALCLGYWCWTIVGMVCLAEARRRWPQLPDAADRYEREGVYGLMSWQGFMFCVVVAVPIACLFGVYVSYAILALPWVADVSQRPPVAVCMVLSYSITLLTFTIDYLRVRLAANEVRAEAAQRRALETQLQLLQAQLEPHMMFNTLANLHALIESDPVRAQDMLGRLIAFLRATLSGSRAKTHPLSEEFSRAADYLALMQVRMGARLKVTLDLPPNLAGCPVPPLLLQPLVENAIKHGLEPSRQGGELVVRAEHEGTELVLTVTDTGRGLRAAEAARRGAVGFGLVCVRDRLKSAYGDAADLEITPLNEQAGTTATLRLPMPSLPAGVPPAPRPQAAATH